ncbi:MAG: MnhB domain-containing protein [Actinomycetota bacterium]
MIEPRSPIIRAGIQVAAPLALVVAAYLLFAGHNQPGGGFSAGLMIGAVIAMRTVTGLQTPTRAERLLSLGGLVVAVVAFAPLLFGEPLLDQVVIEGTVPVLGKVKTGSALVFDIGVVLIVVGLVSAVLEGLGGADLDQPTEPRVDR